MIQFYFISEAVLQQGLSAATSQMAAFEAIAARIRAVPGVQSLTYSYNRLFGGTDNGDRITVDGYTPADPMTTQSRYDAVAPGYFSTLGITGVTFIIKPRGGASVLADVRQVIQRTEPIIAMIARETGWLVVAGLVVGGALSVAAVRLISSRLYGLSPTDPATFASAVAAMALVAVIATWLPARRTTRVDAIGALRFE